MPVLGSNQQGSIITKRLSPAVNFPVPLPNDDVMANGCAVRLPFVRQRWESPGPKARIVGIEFEERAHRQFWP
jgi:hypothetical protein